MMNSKGRRRGLKRMLGMTQRPTAAGQATFGDVDVTGSYGNEDYMRDSAGGAGGAGGGGLGRFLKKPGVSQSLIAMGAQMMNQPGTEQERRRLRGWR